MYDGNSIRSKHQKLGIVAAEKLGMSCFRRLRELNKSKRSFENAIV